MPEDELLTEREAAALLRLSQRTLQRLHAEGGAPPKVRLTMRRIAYRRSDLLAWIAGRNTVQNIVAATA